MATGRWQPSATKGVIWDAFDWGLGPEEVGSVAGVTTSAGSASGSEGALGAPPGTPPQRSSGPGRLGSPPPTTV